MDVDSAAILYVAERLGGFVGGDIAPLTNLACLAQAGFPLMVCSREESHGLAAFEAAARLPRIDLPRYPRYGLWLDRTLPRSLWAWLRSEAAEVPRRRRLRRLRPDWVVAAVPAADAIIREHRIRGRRTLMVNHGCPSCYGTAMRHPWPDLPGLVAAMARYDRLGFLTRSCLEEWCGFPELRGRPAAVLGEAVDEPAGRRLAQSPKADLRRKLGMAEDRFVLVCVASIQHRKGQDYLIEHAEALREAVPSLEVWLVGPVLETMGGREILDAMARKRPAGFHVRGAVSNAMEFIRAADALVMPSRAEAFGMPLVEAMLLRTPAIAANLDGMKEVLDGGAVGWLFSHQDPDSLAAALSDVASGAGVAQKLDAAEKRYWAEYCWEAGARRWREALSWIP